MFFPCLNYIKFKSFIYVATYLWNTYMKKDKEDLHSNSKYIHNTFFKNEFNNGELKNLAIRGGTITVIVQGVKYLLRIISTIILARILTPSDFGLVAMVGVLINLVTMFKDIGLSMATIQKSEINHNQISNLFWINVLIGFLIALFVSAISPIISWFYGEQRLIGITISLGSTFIFFGLTAQHHALLKRQMRFFLIGIVEISAMLLSALISILLALQGEGYWSIVFREIFLSAFIAIGVWIVCKWRPGFPKKDVSVKEMLMFGGNITISNLIRYFGNNSDKLLLGKFYGSNPLGLYKKAFDLLMLPIAQIGTPLLTVSTPTLSRLQDKPLQFKLFYLKLVSIIAFITMPLTAFLAVCAQETILFLLGPKWIDAAPIFKMLSIAAFLKPIMDTRGILLISLGKSKRFLINQIFTSTILVIAFIAGIPTGITGVAKAYAIATYLMFIPVLTHSFHTTPVNFKDYILSVIRPALGSFFVFFSIFLTKPFLKNFNSIITLIFCFLISIIAYMVFWLLLPGGIKLLKTYYFELYNSFKRK